MYLKQTPNDFTHMHKANTQKSHRNLLSWCFYSKSIYSVVRETRRWSVRRDAAITKKNDVDSENTYIYIYSSHSQPTRRHWRQTEIYMCNLLLSYSFVFAITFLSFSLSVHFFKPPGAIHMLMHLLFLLLDHPRNARCYISLFHTNKHTRTPTHTPPHIQSLCPDLWTLLRTGRSNHRPYPRVPDSIVYSLS